MVGQRRRIRKVRELNKIERVLHKISLGVVFIIEKGTFLASVFVLPPVLYYYMMFHVRPAVAVDSGILRDAIEIFLNTFALVNVLGNCILNLITDTSLKSLVPSHLPSGEMREGQSPGRLRYCEKCKVYQPVGTWHCKRCDVCIVQREYHCFVLAQCVARHTKRYYLLAMAHILFSMLYELLYIIQYPCNFDFDSVQNHPVFLVIKFFAAHHVHILKSLNQQICVLKLPLLSFNVLVIFFTASHLGYNVWHMFKGRYPWQKMAAKKGYMPVEIQKRPLIKEIEEVFGSRWYLAFFWPFVDSPLPGTKQEM